MALHKIKSVFDGALPRQKHHEASNASPRADQPERLTQAEGDKREYLDCKPEFAIEILKKEVLLEWHRK